LTHPDHVSLTDLGAAPNRQSLDDHEMQRLRRDKGMTGFLSELVTAPPAVLRVLCDFHKIHNVLVGDARTEAEVSRGLLEELCSAGERGGGGRSVSLYTCGRPHINHHTSSISRYSGNLTSSSKGIREASVLSRVTDNQAACRALQAEISRLDDELKALTNGEWEGRSGSQINASSASAAWHVPTIAS
jgi:hypothetical protein